jgi:hypothetical protein
MMRSHLHAECQEAGTEHSFPLAVLLSGGNNNLEILHEWKSKYREHAFAHTSNSLICLLIVEDILKVEKN